MGSSVAFRPLAEATSPKKLSERSTALARPVTVNIPHSLGKEKARKVAAAAFDSYKARFAEYNPTTTWVNPDKAEISFKVPTA